MHVEVLRMKLMPMQCISFKKRQMTGRRATEPILQYWTRLCSQHQSLVWRNNRDSKLNRLKGLWRLSWKMTDLPSLYITFIHFPSISCFCCYPIKIPIVQRCLKIYLWSLSSWKKSSSCCSSAVLVVLWSKESYSDRRKKDGFKNFDFGISYRSGILLDLQYFATCQSANHEKYQRWGQSIGPRCR